MKKLLLVLMVVAMASFLFVGCLPGVTTPEEPEEPEVPTEPAAVTIAVEHEYLATTGVVYVRGNAAAPKDVVVTFPEAVAAEYIVKVAIKLETTTTPYYVYVPLKDATPDVTRKIWTATNIDFSSTAVYPYTLGTEEKNFSFADCTSYCLVALEKHPCCPGVEVALKVVTVDMTAPLADLKVTFKDCADVCDPDPCATGAAYFTFTSVTPATACDPAVDCCGDACSGLASWTIAVTPATSCLAGCEVLTGVCPVVGSSGCTCLAYAAGTEADPDNTYKVTYTLLDNVGNKFTEDWTIVVDTDSVVSFTGGDATVTPVVFGTAITVHDVLTANCP